MRKIILLGLSSLLFASCQPKQPRTNPDPTISLENVNSIDLGQFMEGIHFVQLENQSESAFTDIDKIIVYGENMFMLDKRLEAVFCFDTTGKFRYRIQRVGRGPGEYQELDAIWVNTKENELWLQAFWPSMIMIFDFDGNLIRHFPIRWSARDMVRIGDNLLVGYNSSGSTDDFDSLYGGLFLIDEGGKYKGQPLALGNNLSYWSLNYQRHLEEYENGALLLSQSDTIFRIDEQGKVSTDVVLDWGKLKFPDDLKEIGFDSPRIKETFNEDYIFGKDQLVAFGPIRLFKIIKGNHGEFAVADLSKQKGEYSTQLTCNDSRVPLIYPLGKSTNNELIGMYSMEILLAIKESQADRPDDKKTNELYHVIDSLVATAMMEDRPVLWFARIKKEWTSKND